MREGQMMSTAMLTDEFINGLTIGAGCAAFGLVGLPEHELDLALHNARHEIVTQFNGRGDERAMAIAEAFSTAVRTCRAALQAARTQGQPQ
jgi:hypothetical protein